jgi:molybdenum cofactor guanylyltransferase
MGRDKAWVEWRGQPLLHHVLQSLKSQTPFAPSQIWLSASERDTRHTDLGLAGVITDPPTHTGAGPLAGILAGLQACTSNWLLVVPCDTPSLPTDLLARLAHAVDSAHPVAVAATVVQPQASRRVHPVIALIHRQCAPLIAQQLARDDRRLMHWLQRQPHRVVSFDAPQDFANVNDLDALRNLPA